MPLIVEEILDPKVNTLRNLAELLETEETLNLFIQELELASLQEERMYSDEMSFVDEIAPYQRTISLYSSINTCI